jgi:hypothetical protein
VQSDRLGMGQIRIGQIERRTGPPGFVDGHAIDEHLVVPRAQVPGHGGVVDAAG